MIAVVSQRGSLTASFGSHRYGHGLGCTREPMAPDVRVQLEVVCTSELLAREHQLDEEI